MQDMSAIFQQSITEAYAARTDKAVASLDATAERVRAAAEDFEAVFVTQMLQHMFSSIEVDENFGGGHAEETWRTLLMDEYGKAIVRSGGIGVADQVERELLRLQEVH